MEKNIILAGVGGQGILSIAYVIDNAALDAGFHFKQAEVHGMAQRGGAVQSNLRYGDSEIWSDIIPTGKADVVLSIEPFEVLRYQHYLRPGGWVVTSTTPYVNIPDYPENDDRSSPSSPSSRTSSWSTPPTSPVLQVTSAPRTWSQSAPPRRCSISKRTGC